MPTRNNTYAALGLLTAFILLTFAAAASADDWCGTRVLPEDVPYVRALQESGVYDPPEWPVGALYVPLTLHVVRDSNGNGGLSDERLVRALDDANLYYANGGIRFCWPGPTDYIDDDDFYFNIDTMAEIDALRQTNVVPNTVNIYFTENLAYEGGPICGISSFTFSDVQGIVIANGCTATDENHSTFSHEIGHYFDLFHTHETAFGDECADGSNCDTAGDLLCDTPADPGLGTHNVDENCAYVGNETDPCNNDPYNPDPTNLMSYSRKHCRDNFSAQQDGRALATLQNLRPELMWDKCPGENQWNLDAKLLAEDGAEGDRFGYSVSISTETALVGAIYDDEHGTLSGSAYVFRKVGGVWGQEAKLLASDGTAYDYFADSVSISGDTALVGADYDDDCGTSSGSAYVFRKLDGIWFEEAKLLASDGAPGDCFGVSVSLDGKSALVGAHQDDDQGYESGSVYVFRNVGGLWSQEAKLTAGDGAPGDRFGYSVSLSGDTALIGAIYDDDNGDYSGSAYVFQKVGDVWIQQAKLIASDGAPDDYFGFSVSLSGDKALIGAHQDDDYGYDSGSAYLFHKVAGRWIQEAKLTGTDGASADYFGRSVSISGDTALAGAVYDDDLGNACGSTYVFQNIHGAWVQQAKLVASDGAPDDRFGWCVAVNGESALIGALWDDDQGHRAGSAYVFRDLNALRNPCPGDLDGDDDTDQADLGILLSDWGCTGGNCPGDLDHDGDTDQSDLGILLADWNCDAY